MSTRFGIMGTGSIASSFARDLAHAQGPEAVAVGSRTRDAANRFAAEHGIGAAYGSYEELVADPGVDVVYIATPQSRHHADARLAIAAGKAVLCEKPFMLSAAEARDVVAAARAGGVLLVEAMWTRFLPHMRRISELVADGAVGTVTTVMADHGQYLPDDGTHDRFYRPDLAGGALLDLGIYPVSFATAMLGAPERVTATASMLPVGLDAQTSAVLTYEDGAHAVLATSLRARTPVRATICGTLGRIEIEPWWFTPTSFTLYRADAEPEWFDERIDGTGLWCQAAAVSDLLRNGGTESALMPHEESIAVLEVMDEIRAQIGLTFPSETAPGSPTPVGG